MPRSEAAQTTDGVKGLNTAKVLRASLLMLVLLATAFCAENWEIWSHLHSHIGVFPLLVFLVVTTFAVAVYVKTRDIARLQDAIHAIKNRPSVVSDGLDARPARIGTREYLAPALQEVKNPEMLISALTEVVENGEKAALMLKAIRNEHRA